MKNSDSIIIQKKTAIFLSLFLIFSFLVFFSCSDQEAVKKERIIIGISSDAQTINPMYAFSVTEGNLIDLLFMKPAMEIWNNETGKIDFKPLLAESWEWSEDSLSLTLNLRENIYWSDNNPITTEDIIFSFDVYSDPQVNSRFLGLFEKFNLEKSGQIDIKKTFKTLSEKSIVITFKKGTVPTLLDINYEIVPKHIWSEVKRDEIEKSGFNFEPVTSGPFKLKKWEKEFSVSLEIDSNSFLYNPDNIQEIVFKIIPDYNARITQLRTGEIDLLDNIKSEDAVKLKSSNNISVTSLRGRDYDYIGWNHRDPQELQKSGTAKSKYFASPEVRKALTLAINRKEILNSFLGEFGEISNGPVSPMFKSYYNNQIKADEYNPSKAKELLNENDWKDTDNDGILEKNNIEFNFDIYINAGNPRREFAATVIKNNLKSVGINANIQSVETGVFINGLMKRNFDAWIAGWTIPVPIDLNPYWNSDKETGFLNFSGYKNNEVDDILNKLQKKISESKKADLYKKLQEIFYKDEPVTFLYWFDNIVAYNKNLPDIKISILGLVKNAWEWKSK